MTDRVPGDLVLIEPLQQGNLVELSNGAPFPEVLTGRLRLAGGQLLTLSMKVEAGRPVLTRCVVDRAPGGAPLSATVLHDLPLADIVGRIVEVVGQFAYMEAQAGIEEEASFPLADLRRAGNRASSSLRGRPVSDEDLASVSEILRRNKFSPRKEIHQRLHVSERTASRWIKLAQERAQETGERS